MPREGSVMEHQVRFYLPSLVFTARSCCFPSQEADISGRVWKCLYCSCLTKAAGCGLFVKISRNSKMCPVRRDMPSLPPHLQGNWCTSSSGGLFLPLCPYLRKLVYRSQPREAVLLSSQDCGFWRQSWASALQCPLPAQIPLL